MICAKTYFKRENEAVSIVPWYCVSSITDNVNIGNIPGMSIRPFEAFRHEQESNCPTDSSLLPYYHNIW